MLGTGMRREALVALTSAACWAAAQVRAAPAATEPLLYATTSQGVTVIDTSTNTVVSTIVLGPSSGLAVSPDGTLLYVGADVDRDFMLSVVDASTSAVVAVIPMVGRVDVIRLSPDGTRGYATNAALCRTVTECVGSSGISVFDAETKTVLATLQLGDPVFGGPRDIAVAPSGELVFVVENASRVTTIDARTNTVISVRPHGCCLSSLTLTPDGSTAYISGAELGAGFIGIADAITGNFLT